MESGVPDSAPSEARRGPLRAMRGRTRVVVFIALLACVVFVSLGSVVAASKASRPAGKVSLTSKPPVITIFQPGPSTAPQPKNPGPPPATCNCSFTSVPKPPTGPPSTGQFILVSLTKEWLWAYQDGKQVFDTPVTTGRPELPTVTGTFHVQGKYAPIEFTSPWPKGSPFWYAPTHINYAMLFADGGYFLHDAWWRTDFGPGSNVPHTGPTGQWETGSHGCVQMPTSSAQWLYNWVGVGTTVEVNG